MKIYIKNMACSCCSMLVKDEVEKLGIQVMNVGLGEIEIKGDVTKEHLKLLNTELKKAGMEIIENRKSILLAKIKKAIHDLIYNTKEKLTVKYSDYLSGKVGHQYSYISKFFSEMQSDTIEQYMIKLRVERVKELLIFHDLTLEEIAKQLHYSSVPHLSSQFKKIMGLAPSVYRRNKMEEA